MNNFVRFPSLTKINSHVTITEKIDGTNAQIHFYDSEKPLFRVFSRDREITPRKLTDIENNYFNNEVLTNDIS